MTPTSSSSRTRPVIRLKKSGSSEALNSVSKFWSIPELVARVMAFLPKAPLYRCSLVAKCVSCHALDSLYARQVRLINWFNILVPLSKSKGYMNFTRAPTLDDWDHFQSYAIRAKSIEAHGSDISNLSYASFLSFFTMIPPGQVLFPRLQSLKWVGDSAVTTRLMNMFIHPDLTELNVSAPLSFMSGVFGVAARFSPSLRRLTFSLVEDEAQIQIPSSLQDEFATAAQSFEHLEFLHVPPFFVTHDIAQVLSKKNRLSVIWACNLRSGCTVDEEDDTDLSLPTEFPLLNDLSSDIRSFMNGLATPSLLTLHVDASSSTTAEDLAHCARLIAEKCRRLQALSFSFSNSADVDEESEESDSPVTLQLLKDLVSIPSLLCLEVDDLRPPNINDEDLAELAPLCASLTVLNICLSAAKPGSHVNSPTLKSLIPFAQHCPKLQNIGYYMDASLTPPKLPDGYSPLSSFVLDICGQTKIRDPIVVAAFLMELLAPDADIQVDPLRCYENTDGTGTEALIQPNSVCRTQWNEVHRMLRGFKSIREKYLQRPRVSGVGSSNGSADAPMSLGVVNGQD